MAGRDRYVAEETLDNDTKPGLIENKDQGNVPSTSRAGRKAAQEAEGLWQEACTGATSPFSEDGL